jgi:hypothetical protein
MQLVQLFLPNYLMETPFHSILADNNFIFFNEIVEKFKPNYNMLLERNILDKIKDMFVFILENIYSYDMSTMKTSYCISNDECTDDEIDQTTSENLKLIKELFEKIKENISKELQSHKELLLPY